MAKVYEICTQREITPLYLDIKKAIDAGRCVKVEVKSAASKTMEQLGYYWSVVLPRIREGMLEQGNEMSLSEINKFLNEKFFCVTKTLAWKDKNGVQHVHIICTPKSKSGASKDQMSVFLDQVIRWASSELGCYIPEPNRSDFTNTNAYFSEGSNV